ncbi:hypothetical protein JCM8097_008823 [Rhodosporidiobolus ruineniae]
MPLLGSSTQHFRSYGKRRTNVTNRRVPLRGWGDSPKGGREEEETTTAGSSSESEEELKVKHKSSVGRGATKKTLLGSKQQLAPKRLAASSAKDKENAAPPPARHPSAVPMAAGKKPTPATKGRGKVILTSTDEEEEEEEEPVKPLRRAPLAAKARPSTAAPAKKTYGGRTKAQPVVVKLAEEATEEEDEEDAFQPPRRRSGQAVIVSEEEEESEVEVVQDRAAPSLVDEAASSSSEAEEEANDEPVLLSRVAPRTSSTSSRRLIHPRTPTSRASLTSYRSSRLSSPLSSLADSSSSSLLAPRPSPSPSPHTLPSALTPLLPLLLSPTPLSFSSLLSAPPPPFAYFSDPAARPEWRKIGEASYSEVFETMGEEGEDVVVKIIPIASGSNGGEKEGTGEEEEEEERPYMSEPDAVRREIEVSALLGGSSDGEKGGLDGFVRFKGAFLVQGSYPDQLLEAWDAYKAAQFPPCDDQIRPDVLPPTQLYALLLLDNAGRDLESYRLRSWTEAASVLGQVVETVGRAEGEREFEHRDLHWGNILLSPTSPSSPTIPSVTPRLNRRLSALSLSAAPHRRSSLTGTPPRRTSAGRTAEQNEGEFEFLRPEKSGVKATLIDFTLSRVDSTGRKGKGLGREVLFDAFEDECVFEGEGDYQFDVYRMMRTLVEREGGGWEASHPKTNVLWLHYLALKLLHSKKLKPPAPLPSTSSTTASRFSSAAYPPSPARPAPSPFRRTTRRSSVLPSSSLGANSPARRPRTFPSSSSTSRATAPLSAAQRKELEREHRAYAMLKRAEDGLGRAIEAWGLGEPTRGKGRGKKGSTTSARGRGKTVSKRDDQEEEGGFASAGEFGRWWLATGERE